MFVIVLSIGCLYIKVWREYIFLRSIELREVLLEQRQDKNDSIQSKIIPILKLPRFFPHRLGGEKARQIQS